MYFSKDNAVTAEMIAERALFHLKYSRGKTLQVATDFDKFWSFAHVVRDLVIDGFTATQEEYLQKDVKRVYYLSMEFLIGKLLERNVLALDILKPSIEALKKLDIDLSTVIQMDIEAGLGNGGLGRLAACFLDSMASMELPAYGYGLRYEHGIFRQEFEDGWQQERPDNWLELGYPWEMVRPEYTMPVFVYGRVENISDTRRGKQPVWTDWQMFKAVPYDIPMIGFQTNTVNMLRLWSARADEGFRLDVFNQGDYVRAVEEKNWAENVTKVLYPSDNTHAGQELRLIQEYFLVSCSVRDIVRRHEKKHSDLRDFAEKNAVQMNDTHPALAVAELMRIFCDEYEMPWDNAWEITTKTCAYTNHTLLPEALETWPVELINRVLPRHLQIIYEINHRFLQRVEMAHPGNSELIQKVSLIEENGHRSVRMANLAVVGSHAVNGVAGLHSKLLRERVMPEMSELYPNKFINVTNGITHRRWLLKCNPELSALITDKIGSGWIHNLKELTKLEPLATDKAFQKEFMAIKRRNKEALGKMIENDLHIPIHPDSLFDVQVKRLHMYKRQLLSTMYLITLYQRIKANPKMDILPRTFVFAAKAAPGYHLAKRLIKLINSVAVVVNHDPDVAGRLKVVFLPDYNVSLAEKIIPAADLSEQISTAGKEASGTGNMKLSLNGALTIGTWDGANIEIAQHVGEENIFIFGHREEELHALAQNSYNPWTYYDNDQELQHVLEAIRVNSFDPSQPALFMDLFDDLTRHGDPFFYMADYRLYLDAQEKVEALFRQPEAWAEKSILNVARMGWFSSDRTINEYAEKIWGIKPISIPDTE
ncbi:glycogen/starch/alpha-glucan phosphorylase [Tichowtungia aerotolerans]|uniref:Alpha-1,4 glucan phosphorylase n=1 Tax=Tichowtungia aerotolerans TaxID=2697043 RepID=A0A6P1M9F0_9BACT|nr:glycogen/starch/alpha-glucan phosphorylase [Tichowtungia aerotolerans]QHI70527.1 glycogen/starch/alpha-glucan family phosphorylase [Tichowtungia aerotolerans]